MNVYKTIAEKLKKSKLHMTLIDPDKQTPSDAGEIAASAEKAGTDAIMVGGSTGAEGRIVDDTVKAIKKRVKLPVILFPTGANAISAHADAIYFMSMLNSKDINFLVREQMRGAPFIKKIALEPIPMGYIVIEPGMKAGEVGGAEAIKRDDAASAVNYAISAEYFGMKLVYLEAGSGAPEHVPEGMISEVKKHLGIPLIVGGGIRTAKSAKAIADAGADIIVTGTLVEKAGDVYGTLRPLIDAIKKR